ncbi:two component transcriptional regulator, LuxR family [Rhizobiales bacterium GAS113]|nr:two component transcriptional regulator, LuxR family [Rhizobiales bacterium GAS113]
MSANPLVSIIDDDESVRRSLAFMLQSAGFRVATYESAMAFLDAPPHIGDGCVVTDIRMPEMDGIELLRRMRSSGRNLQVIVMTGHGDVPLAVEAMKLGALDFLEKPFDHEILLTTIRAALNNGEASSQLEEQAREIVERIKSLTARERQVLDSLVAGQSNKIIGRDLEISPRTVEIYRANVMTKMRAASLSELVRLAIKAGLS